MADTQNTFILFQKLPDENHHGANLPVAALVRLSERLKHRLIGSSLDVESDFFRKVELNVSPDDVRWLSRVAFDSEGGLAPVPNWFAPERDQIIYAGDSENMEMDGDAVDFAEFCEVYTHEGVPSTVLTLEKYQGRMLIGAGGETSSYWNLRTPCESWADVAKALGEEAAETTAERHRSLIMSNTKYVSITCDVSEDEQESGYMNYTLQGAGDKVAFSIETSLQVPTHLHDKGEAVIAEFIKSALSQASANLPELSFAVVIGKSREAEHEEARERQRT